MKLLLVIALSWLSFSADKSAKAQDEIKVPAQGQVDREAIRKVFELGASKIEKCYKDKVKNNAEGKVVLDLTFDKKGKVKAISVDRSKSVMAENPEFETCLEDLVRTWIFPPAPSSAESVQVFYPLTFAKTK